MRIITNEQIVALIEQAGQSERKRVIFRLHEHEEQIQRMVNALVPGTYVPPHKHVNPHKLELVSILVGRVAIVRFDDDGEITEIHILDEDGPEKVADIAPGEYHSAVALMPSAILEIVPGPYVEETHKKFADFAPLEDDPGAAEYLRELEKRVKGIA
jgi:cupin fold WbuC family metalloprotein